DPSAARTIAIAIPTDPRVTSSPGTRSLCHPACPRAILQVRLRHSHRRRQMGPLGAGVPPALALHPAPLAVSASTVAGAAAVGTVGGGGGDSSGAPVRDQHVRLGGRALQGVSALAVLSAQQGAGAGRVLAASA